MLAHFISGSKGAQNFHHFLPKDKSPTSAVAVQFHPLVTIFPSSFPQSFFRLFMFLLHRRLSAVVISIYHSHCGDEGGGVDINRIDNSSHFPLILPPCPLLPRKISTTIHSSPSPSPVITAIRASHWPFVCVSGVCGWQQSSSSRCCHFLFNLPSSSAPSSFLSSILSF